MNTGDRLLIAALGPRAASPFLEHRVRRRERNVVRLEADALESAVLNRAFLDDDDRRDLMRYVHRCTHTRHDRQVWRLFRAGCDYTEIGERLHCDPRRVRSAIGYLMVAARGEMRHDQWVGLDRILALLDTLKSSWRIEPKE